MKSRYWMLDKRFARLPAWIGLCDGTQVSCFAFQWPSAVTVVKYPPLAGVQGVDDGVN